MEATYVMDGVHNGPSNSKKKALGNKFEVSDLESQGFTHNFQSCQESGCMETHWEGLVLGWMEMHWQGLALMIWNMQMNKYVV